MYNENIKRVHTSHLHKANTATVWTDTVPQTWDTFKHSLMSIPIMAIIIGNYDHAYDALHAQ